MNGEINQKYSPAAPKRALFVVTQSEMGGAQRFYYNFISGLDRSKYEILIAVGSDGGGDLLARFKENGFSVRELKFLSGDISFFNDLRELLELRRLIKNFHADTLFLNS